jgi:UPF0716 protein FxsA
MKLLAKLFLLFTVVSLVEMYLLLKLTYITNIWVTLALTMTSGMIGSYLAKREGLRAFKQFRAALSMEQEPTAAIIDGGMLLVAAAFLIAPGMLTDIAGLLLMIPAVRRPIGRYAQRRIMRAVQQRIDNGLLSFVSGGFSTGFDSDFARGPLARPERGDVIDIKPEN